MFTLLIAIFFGLVCLASITLLVIVVVISRREDFINPFSNQKQETQPIREISAETEKTNQ